MDKVAILLCTFNGERYIDYLIDSIREQSFTDWILYIHDDGSTDKTIQICSHYNEVDKRVIIVNDANKHRGAKDSFLWLLEQVEADYYLFCDQDDIWLPFKIEQSLEYIRQIENHNPNKPICIHTDLTIVDKHHNMISTSLWKSSKIKPKFLENKNYIQVFNCVTGCTMIFNSIAKRCAFPVNGKAPMHDFWVAYSCLANGGVVSHINKPTVLYCQHEDNKIGANIIDRSYASNKIIHFSRTIKENVSQFQIMHKISGISFYKYLLCKVSYEFVRFI